MHFKAKVLIVLCGLTSMVPLATALAQPDYTKVEQKAAYCKGGSEVWAAFWDRMAAYEGMTYKSREPYRKARDEGYARIQRYNKFLAGRGDFTEAYAAGRQASQTCLNDQVSRDSCSAKCHDAGGTSEQCAEKCPLPASCTVEPSCVGFELP